MWAKLFIILKPHTNQDTSLIGKSLCHIASLFKFAFACDLVDASPPQNEFISIPLASFFQMAFWIPWNPSQISSLKNYPEEWN